ncbi:hypothetical protein EYZ11_011856 [Aspergillus tanneri]|uniref:Major facilitator superfamily (MFS) profile domain-containing protein n=1 Tax=Aspergillus tanneri TaxID=1220188 RepID=A0A4S3J1Q4_9EURO|nr:hypothetical protein EYZ11_011856 [Aspergillus tanneri]
MPSQAESKAAANPGEVEKTNIYNGQGSKEDPFVVEFHKDDPEDPMNWSQSRKWFITTIVTLSVFAVTLTSSAYSVSANEVIEHFNISTEVFIVGLSLFVLGFAIGPAVWGPLLTILYLTNSLDNLPRRLGGLRRRFCRKPKHYYTPSIAILQWHFWWVTIGVVGILGFIFVPETYGPVLLIRKASHLSKTDGNVYISVVEKSQGKKKPSEVFKRTLLRPWVLLFREPIVLVASLYMAIIYGTVYMFMGAMPIVYNEDRGWSEGIGGLAFMGIAVGIILGLVYVIYDNNGRYMKLFLSKSATAESRLPPAIIGAIALPVGMFAFAWTNHPSIHWSVSIILSTPFGFGCVLVILPIINYLIDSYTIYAASVLAAAAIFRSIVGAVFPLFTTQMYNNLGIHWATSVPAFLTLVCMPFPFVMYRYGGAPRMKRKYAFEAAEIMKQMQMQQAHVLDKEKDSPSE